MNAAVSSKERPELLGTATSSTITGNDTGHAD